jgi:hypothetical protein
MSCKYKDIFGKPSEGVHSIRLFDLAVIDVIMVIIGGLFIAYYFNYNKYKVIGILFLIGIISHRLFCVRTTIDKLLFNDNNDD